MCDRGEIETGLVGRWGTAITASYDSRNSYCPVVRRMGVDREQCCASIIYNGVRVTCVRRSRHLVRHLHDTSHTRTYVHVRALVRGFVTLADIPLGVRLYVRAHTCARCVRVCRVVCLNPAWSGARVLAIEVTFSTPLALSVTHSAHEWNHEFPAATDSFDASCEWWRRWHRRLRGSSHAWSSRNVDIARLVRSLAQFLDTALSNEGGIGFPTARLDIAHVHISGTYTSA